MILDAQQQLTCSLISGDALSDDSANSHASSADKASDSDYLAASVAAAKVNLAFFGAHSNSNTDDQANDYNSANDYDFDYDYHDDYSQSSANSNTLDYDYGNVQPDPNDYADDYKGGKNDHCIC